jgi:hypothetical protein
LESAIVSEVVVGILVQIGVSIALWKWGQSVARRHPRKFWQRSAWMPLIALVLSIVGLLTTITMLVKSFGAVAGADPAVKATVLAQGISEAMNWTAFLVLPAWGLYLASLVIFLVGTLKLPS